MCPPVPEPQHERIASVEGVREIRAYDVTSVGLAIDTGLVEAVAPRIFGLHITSLCVCSDALCRRCCP